MSTGIAHTLPREQRDRLPAFAAAVFGPLPRADQRAKAELYLRGLLLDGGRKSMQPMAARLGVDHQALQQFVTSSTWDFTAVRAGLARRAELLVQPVAWVVGECAFLKEGNGSPGVARQFAQAEGRAVNCQLGVAVQLVGAQAAAAVDWRLALPEDWDGTLPGQGREVQLRRRRCGIPDRERVRPRWLAALEMIDELGRWGLRPPVVAAGPGMGGVEFRAGLRSRAIPFLAASDSELHNGAFVHGPGIVRMAERALREMKDEVGLDHFEGRSWVGWNRHVTLASAAYLYRVAQGRRTGEHLRVG